MQEYVAHQVILAFWENVIFILSPLAIVTCLIVSTKTNNEWINLTFGYFINDFVDER